MQSARLLLVLLALAACRGRDSATPPPPGGDLASDAPRDSFMVPPVVTKATVVVFILPAVDDSMLPEDAATAMEDFRAATAEAAPFFQAHGIAMVFTNSDSVIVVLPNRRRTVITLDGLDAPFGYVLIEPGLSEQILTGVYDPDELEEEARNYYTAFGADSLPRRRS